MTVNESATPLPRPPGERPPEVASPLAPPLRLEPLAQHEDPKPLNWKGAAPLPSKLVKQSKALQAIWNVVKYILNLIVWISGLWLIVNPIKNRLCKKFELALYEDIVLSSSGRHLMGASPSVLLNYLTDFFKLSPETPAALVKQIGQAARWSEKLEAAESSWTHDKKQKRLGELAAEIGREIQALKEGESLLAAGGLCLKNVQQPFLSQQFAMYRVTKEAKGYRLEVHSRDGMIAGTSFSLQEGQEKISSVIGFSGIEEAKLSDPALWHALLSLHLPPSADDKAGAEWEGYFTNILSDFLGRPGLALKGLLDLKENGPGDLQTESPLEKLLPLFEQNLERETGNHHAERQLNRVQNLWNVVYDKKTGQRQKLRLHLETLFKFFEAVKDGLAELPLQRFYLKEGLQALSQTVDTLHQKGSLSTEDWISISTELNAIEQYVKASEERPALKASLSWFSSLPQVAIETTAIQKLTSDLTYAGEIPFLEEQPKVAQIPAAREAAQPSANGKLIALDEIDTAYRAMQVEIRPETLATDLQRLAAQGKKNQDRVVEMQHEIVRSILSLPGWVESGVGEIKNNLWLTLSVSERFHILESLTELCEQIVLHIQDNNSCFPDRISALSRIRNLSDYLTRIDEKESGFTQQYGMYASISEHRLSIISFRDRLSAAALRNEEQEDLKHWHLQYARRNVWCEQNKKLSTKEFKDWPATKYKELLVRQLQSLEKILKEHMGWHKAGWLSKLSSWGLPIEHPMMRAAANSFKLGTESSDYSHKGNTTQEAVMDNPQKALKRVYSDIFLGGVESAKRKLPSQQLPSVEDFQAFLLALEDKMAIWNLLGIIEKSPELLSFFECRSALEIFFIRGIKETLKADPDLPAFLGDFFRRHIHRYWDRGDWESSLFLVRLAHTLRLFEPQICAHLDFQQFVQVKFDTCQEPVQRHLLATEFLWSLQRQKKISLADARRFLVFGFFFEHSQLTPESFDPVIDDEIRFALRRRAPFVVEQIGEDIQSVLDEICLLKGIPLPAGKWSGEYPVYRAGEIEIDLSRGAINDDRTGFALPPALLRSLSFRELFPKLRKEARLGGQPLKIPNGHAYTFKDSQGIEWRAESRRDQYFFYKKEEGQWLQYISKRDFLLPKSLKTPLPDYIQNQTFFVSANNPREFWVYNKENTPLFKINLRSKDKNGNQTVDRVDDLRAGGEMRQKMQVSPLSYMEPVHLHPFLSFEEGKQILVWSKSGTIKEIELPRHNLRFRIEKGGELICATPPFLGYRLMRNTASFPVLQGLPVSLPLAPPVGSEHLPIKLLVPHFQGWHLDMKPSPLLGIKLGFITKKVLSKILPESTHIPKFSWYFSQNENSQEGYWTFEVPPSDPEFGSPQGGAPVCADPESVAPQALLDLLEYTLHQTGVEKRAALFLGKQLLEQLQWVSLKTLSEKSLREQVLRIGALSLIGNPLIVTRIQPETCALGLQILLALKEKAPFFLESEIDGMILSTGMSYFKLGKHIDHNSRLTPVQEDSVREMICKQNPLFFGQLNAKPETRKPFFQAQLRTRSISGVEESLFKALKEKGTPTTPIFSQDLEKLMRTFPRVYKILQGPSNSLDFRKMKLTFRLAPASNFTDFMEMLFDLKEKNPGLVLPELPDVAPFKLTFQDFKEDQQLYKAHRQKSEETFRTFFKDVSELLPDPAAIAAPPHTQNPFLPNKDLLSSLLDIANAKEEHVWKLQEIQIEKAAGDKGKTPPLQSPEESDFLFSADELLEKTEVFSKEASKAPPKPDFSSLDKDPEPSVQKEVDRLNAQLERYEAPELFLVRDPGKLEQQITDKVLFWEKKARQSQEAVDQLLQHSRQQFQAAEKIGGRQLFVTWSDLKTAFLQGDLHSLCVDNKLRGIQEAELTKKLIHYYADKGMHKHALFTQKEYQTAKGENLLDSPATTENLFRLLTRKRGYNLNVYPNLLVIEETLGFLMGENQLNMVWTVLANSHSVCQAVTGAGKTSVIMVLLGLLKANGQNLVTLKFLDPLFAENARHLQKNLSLVMKKRVTTLLFSPKTPITLRLAGGKQQSIFKEMYEDLLQTIQDKGCVITNRKSQPLLEAKFIALLNRAASGDSVQEIDQEHLFFLAKILHLMRSRQETICDEHDKMLHPRDEIHLALGQIDHPPEFAIETVKEVLETALKEKALRLAENGQAELTEQQRSSALEAIAKQMANKWGERGLDPTACFEYFWGLSDRIIDLPFSAEILDKLALTKDLFLTYLPLAFSQTAGQKYILSEEDGESVIPCEYTDIPREGSQFDNVIERLVYSTQYHFQKGVSSAYLKRWYERLRQEGLQEMEKDKLDSLDQTVANRTFQDYFPGQLLPKIISDVQIEKWRLEIASDPTKISRFLNLILPDLSIQRQKVSIDAQNQVSMSHASAGISATEGCELGLHPQFTPPKEKGDDTAKMVRSFLAKAGDSPQLLRYIASQPQNILSQLVEQQPQIGVLIDGAGALLGVRPEVAAQTLFEKTQFDLASVSYFDRSGHLQTIGNADAPMSQKGQMYPHHAARGADAKLSPSIPALLLANGRDPFEAVLQNAGRLRHPSHKLQIAVSEESGIKTLDELLSRSIAVQAKENGDNLYRSELQKIRDAVRSAMLDRLFHLCTHEEMGQSIQQFNHFKEAGSFLVTDQVEDWHESGVYFASHSSIQKKTEKPVNILIKARDKAKALCKQFKLEQSPWLAQYEPETLESYMPTGVWNNTQLTMGQQAQVEVDVQLSVTQEAQVEVQAIADEEEDPAFYLPWVDFSDNRKFGILGFSDFGRIPLKIYDYELTFTENHLPLRRKEWTQKIFHRTPHDRKQNRLHYIAFDYFEGIGNKNPLVTALDIMDVHQIVWDKSENYLIYDTHTRRFMTRNSDWRERPHQTSRAVAQRYKLDKMQIDLGKAWKTHWAWEKSQRTIISETQLNESSAQLKIYKMEMDLLNESSARFKKILKMEMDLKEEEKTYLAWKQSQTIIGETQLNKVVVQFKFEDGQMNGYTDVEKEALLSWLRPHRAIIDEIQTYFYAEVLRSRPRDRDSFPHSQLAGFLETIRQNR